MQECCHGKHVAVTTLSRWCVCACVCLCGCRTYFVLIHIKKNVTVWVKYGTIYARHKFDVGVKTCLNGPIWAYGGLGEVQGKESTTVPRNQGFSVVVSNPCISHWFGSYIT